MTEHTSSPRLNTHQVCSHCIAKTPKNNPAIVHFCQLHKAAPDLLAALEYYLEGEPGPEYVAYRSPKAVREKARDAIAKAKGQTD